MTDTISKAARLAILALINLRGGQKEAEDIAIVLGIDSRTVYRDRKEVDMVAAAVTDLQTRYGLSPLIDKSTYTAEEVGLELGISPRAVRNLAARRGIIGKVVPGQRDRWAFTRADIEALRMRGPGGRPKSG